VLASEWSRARETKKKRGRLAPPASHETTVYRDRTGSLSRGTMATANATTASNEMNTKFSRSTEFDEAR
jgi:hypothetical protein